MTERFQPYVAVSLVLLRNGKVFLQRRFHTGHKDGEYSLPSGHIEGGEPMIGQ